jgi:hypothetical protein
MGQSPAAGMGPRRGIRGPRRGEEGRHRGFTRSHWGTSWGELALCEGLEDNRKPHSQAVPDRASASSPEYLGIDYSGSSKAHKVSRCTGQRCNHCPDADRSRAYKLLVQVIARVLAWVLVCGSRIEYVARPTSHKVFYKGPIKHDVRG